VQGLGSRTGEENLVPVVGWARIAGVPGAGAQDVHEATEVAGVGRGATGRAVEGDGGRACWRTRRTRP
jgi:hypothetical protein